jgi:hypothetical protein
MYYLTESCVLLYQYTNAICSKHCPVGAAVRLEENPMHMPMLENIRNG